MSHNINFLSVERGRLNLNLQNGISGKHKCGYKKLSCKLSSPELRKRKAIVIVNLKKEMLEKKELVNGYTYNFMTQIK
jgi:hypothetical protein